jgi:hypothetical protein
MNWRPHTEKPVALPITALIVVRDEIGELVLLGDIFNLTAHTEGEWRDERTNMPIGYPEYWWLPEEELLAAVPAPMTVEPQAEDT